jgi:hypothetical protein
MKYSYLALLVPETSHLTFFLIGHLIDCHRGR